jgi:hypothetical protein
MVGQTAGGIYGYSEDVASYSVTRQVKPARATLAEVALSRVNDIDPGSGAGVWGQIGITQVVSDKGVENFDPYKQAIYRTGVTSITVTLWVWNTYARGRYIFNFWS